MTGTVNILIDGGTADTYLILKNQKGKREDGPLKTLIGELRQKGQLIDLLILSHIDEDHAGGILRWFGQDSDASAMIKEVWFNGGREISGFLDEEANSDLDLEIYPDGDTLTSFQQGIDFSKFIAGNKKWDRRIFIQGDTIKKFGFTFSFLSPDKEKLQILVKEWRKKKPDYFTAPKQNDYAQSIADHLTADKFEEDPSTSNGSSLAFILEIKNKYFALLGDAHPSVLIKGLSDLGISPQKPLRTELVKLPHHGSAKNTNRELLECFDSPLYIISTNGRTHQHPDKQMLSRLIDLKKHCAIYFNYPERSIPIFSEDDKKLYDAFTIPDNANPIEYEI